METIGHSDGEGNVPNNARGGERGKGETMVMVTARAKARADGKVLPAVGVRVRARAKGERNGGEREGRDPSHGRKSKGRSG